MLLILLVTERVFCSYNLVLPKVKQKMVNEINRNIYSKSVFKELNEDCILPIFIITNYVIKPITYLIN